MADANARLQFLWKASHMLLAHSPQVSSLYMSQFLSLSSDRELRLHEDIQSRACAGCGSIFVPGLNSNVKIVTAVTKQQKERRKAVERRKSKAEKMKAITPNEQEKGHNQGFGIAMNKTSIDTSLTNNINKATSAMFSSQPRKATISTKKKIQIIPYTEQMQKQNQAQRGLGINRVDKAEVRSNQSLNHVVYHCKRCERETEMPGTKKGYLDGRIKPPKTISRKRKQKRQTSQPAATPTPSQSSSLLPCKDTNTLSPTTVAGQKRPRPGFSASMPASPICGLSRTSSAASSAVTSPASSPKRPTHSEKSNSKKKKKTNLASLLASQKAEKGSPPDQEGGGDSVLANFLMGL